MKPCASCLHASSNGPVLTEPFCELGMSTDVLWCYYQHKDAPAPMKGWALVHSIEEEAEAGNIESIVTIDVGDEVVKRRLEGTAKILCNHTEDEWWVIEVPVYIHQILGGA